MGKIYAATDVAMIRSSATTMAELEMFGASLILVPLPESANGHQLENALLYEKNKGQIFLPENELDKRGVDILTPFSSFKKKGKKYESDADNQSKILLEIVKK